MSKEDIHRIGRVWSKTTLTNMTLAWPDTSGSLDLDIAVRLLICKWRTHSSKEITAIGAQLARGGWQCWAPLGSTLFPLATLRRGVGLLTVTPRQGVGTLQAIPIQRVDLCLSLPALLTPDLGLLTGANSHRASCGNSTPGQNQPHCKIHFFADPPAMRVFWNLLSYLNVHIGQENNTASQLLELG